MRKLILIVFISFLFILFPKEALASDYLIDNFGSEITINQDTSITVQETIEVNFLNDRHGIFRYVPVLYKTSGRTINARLKVISVKDETGKAYKYKTSRFKQSIEIKIGDPDTLVRGRKVYEITYSMENVIQRYEDHDELYWNVTGSEWDSDILSASASVNSNYAKIEGVDCFLGEVGSTLRACSYTEKSDSKVNFRGNQKVSPGSDFTIVVALSPNSELVFPGTIKRITNLIEDNWGYPVAFIPLAFIAYFWFIKGRDRRYLSDAYYEPDDKRTKTVPLINRAHLPMVYAPIDNLTPSEVGTVIDEKVDLRDVVSEMVELARLGFIKIELIKKEKKLLKDTTDYSFKKLAHDESKLTSYQKYLLEKLFEDAKEDKILMSELKNKFYKHLSGFKKELYEYVVSQGLFDGNPEKVRQKWLIYFVPVNIACVLLTVLFSSLTANAAPVFVWGFSLLPIGFFIKNMPRKTAKGYSLYRQIKGLHWYLKIGKWKEEISEKRLFLEEMLPLAISLGVVNKLAKDWQELGIAPPRYFTGVTNAYLYSSMVDFEKSASKTVISGATKSGKSSWSGGSGFGGGGFSGGGFGGGGGGSW